MANDEDETPDLERSSGKGNMTRSTTGDGNDGTPGDLKEGSVSSGYGEDSPLNQSEETEAESQNTDNGDQD